MLGGGGTNGNPIFPVLVEENCVHYDNNALPQLQLFGHVPIQCSPGVGTINYMGSRQAPNDNRPVKMAREGEPACTKQKLHICLHNNFCQDEAAGHTGSVLNPVSTGLKLSCEEEERNSSVTSACGNLNSSFPSVIPLANTVKIETERQTEEIGRYIKLQEENILKGVRELNQRHTASLLNALEKGVSKKLHEKDLEIESMNRKNKELGDRIKQVSMEAQSWHYRAKYSESVVNVLKSNIQQLMAQSTGQAREGFGDNEVDDAISCTNHHNIQEPLNRPPKCGACNSKEVSVLLLPCRHLCLCTDCEGFIDVCPMCQVVKTASVQVYM